MIPTVCSVDCEKNSKNIYKSFLYIKISKYFLEMKALKGVSLKSNPKSQNKKYSFTPVSIRHISSSPESEPFEGYYNDDVQEIPDKIIASYHNDYNLLHIHEIIIRKLKEQYSKLDELKRELKANQDISKTPQTIIERKQTNKRIQILQKEIETISTGKRLKEYLAKSEPLIEKYRTIIPRTREIDFTASKAKKREILEKEEKDPRYQEKMSIINKYLNYAQQFIDITVIHRQKNVNQCGCGYELDGVYIDNFGTQICPECGTERYIIGFNLYKSDTLASRNDYSDEDNFEKALMRYQGKQIDKTPDSLFKDLDNYFRSRGLPTSDIIKELPLDHRGKKEGTDLDMLYRALNDTGYSSYYEDAMLIGHLYWGWKLPDVSHLETIVMEDYRKTQRVYNMLPKERSSSLGTQFRLFKHLQLRGHPCSYKDFKIVKMLESLEYHDETWKLMCEGCFDPEIYFIPTH